MCHLRLFLHPDTNITIASASGCPVERCLTGTASDDGLAAHELNSIVGEGPAFHGSMAS